MNPYLATLIGMLIGTGIGYSLKLRSYREKIERKYKNEIALVNANSAREVIAVKDSYEKIVGSHASWVARLLKSRFSLSCRNTRFAVVIGLDGNAEITRSHFGLVSGRGLTLHYMEHNLVCSIEGPGREEIVLIPEQCSPGVTMEPNEIQANAGMYSFRINLPPIESRPKEGVDYAFRVHYQKGFLMTKEEADDAYRDTPTPFENFYYDQEVPSKRLELEVVFPTGYEAVTYAKVYLLGTWTLDYRETAKVEVIKTPNSARLCIENPLHGYRYMLGWDSPLAVEVEKLRKSMVPEMSQR